MKHTLDELLEYKQKANRSTCYDIEFFILARELIPDLIDEIIWHREGQEE